MNAVLNFLNLAAPLFAIAPILVGGLLNQGEHGARRVPTIHSPHTYICDGAELVYPGRAVVDPGSSSGLPGPEMVGRTQR